MKRCLVALALLLPVHAARAQTPGEFDPKLVAAWKGIGAKVGWLQEGERAWRLYHDQKPDPPAVPAIHWPGGRPFEFGLLASMPAPSVPFAFDFARTKASARELSELRGFKNLVALNLDAVPLTDADFKEIAPLKGLKSLYVRYAKVSDDGVKELAGLTKVRVIDIGCTKITDDSLKHFAGMPDLECMFLQFTSIKGTGFKDLRGLPKLRHIFLGGSASDEGLKGVAKLKHLEYLDLWTAQVSDRGLRELVGLTALKSIDLSNTQVSDAGMKILTAIKSLEVVQLYRTKVTDACLNDLGTLPKLRILALPKESTSDEAVARFQKAHPKVTINR